MQALHASLRHVPSTANYVVNVVGSLYKRIITDWELSDMRHPTHGIKLFKMNVRERFLTLAAMQLVMQKMPGHFSAAEIRTLLGYTGWGGLSIDAVRTKFPSGLSPDTFALIHEYYTPPPLANEIADAICALLPTLAGSDGIIRALEPSAGIGRLIGGFSARRCAPLQGAHQSLTLRWTAIEYSNVSSKLLAAIRPDVALHNMPLERWITTEGARQQGTFNFVVSNPPYGERGAAALEDTDPFYKENRAYAYFMRRTLDLLVAGGLGVFLVPAGFLTGNGNRGVRERLLLRHHLAAAFRLPSQTADGRDFVPGANVVMDVLFWRSRGGELTEVDADDQFILDGDYFDRFPQHILGTVDGQSNGEEEAGVARKGRWRYSVTGPRRRSAPAPAGGAGEASPRLQGGRQHHQSADDATRELVAGTASPALVSLVFASLLALAGVSLLACSRWFAREDVVFRI